jgi:hypothetical protein
VKCIKTPKAGGKELQICKNTDLAKEPNEEEEAKKNHKNRATALVCSFASTQNNRGL